MLLLPFILFTIIILILIIKFNSRGPAIFISKRMGKDCKIFNIYKLRTMTKDAPLVPSSNENIELYVTSFGKFLRKTGLDEFPQIFNVINGTMTFVGPRPCLDSELSLIDERRRHKLFSLKPGITGLAQINGGDKLNIYHKLKYECFYLKRKSLSLDIKIILCTIKIYLSKTFI